ncbi:MAG: virulence factor SrfB [Candidatus Ozemobacteraceae bacterium]
MEKIEFLVSTGVSFFAPEHDARFSDLLLQKRWAFRVLQSQKGAISLQIGTDPIQNAISPGNDPLIDIGGLSVRFRDILTASLGKWIPLPYAPKAPGGEPQPSRSTDWVRVFIQRPPLQPDDHVYHLTLAVDTTLQTASPQDAGRERFGFCAEDAGVPFELFPGAVGFWQTPTMLTWVKNLFQSVPIAGGESAPPYAGALAAFMAFMDGLKQADILPELTLLQPEGEPIDVSLILDLGNSRACGILIEQTPGHPVSLDECCKLEIRDLREPRQAYTEPFDTSFKFQPPLFFDPENPIPHAGTNFLWPSIVRLGNEAARLEPSDVGDTGMSSPKRYLWDDEQRHFPWYFNLPDAGLGKKINAPFLKFFDENGVFRGDNAHPPFDFRYPPSSLMTFLILEILSHAYAQINSYTFRKSRGHRLACRVLRNLVITTPCGMSLPEKDIYRQRVQSAVDLLFHVRGLAPEMKPRLHLDFDEATAIQLTFLYGEVKYRFLSDARDALASLGRERLGPDGVKEPVFRLASIDIGGGTSDLMIAEYASVASQPSGIKQRMLFSEGFSTAGDEIAKRIIEKLILRTIFAYAQQKNPNISWEEFQLFFGPGRGGRDKHFLDNKAELCRQVWIPMAHRYLEFAELDADDPDMEISFDRFFPCRMPGGNVLDFFAEHMKRDFDCDITLPEIPWQVSKNKINAVISNVLENILRIFSEVIAQFDCDALILGGKPSSLPIVRELLARLMPVPPARIIGLKGYPVGSWYPFSQKGGGISDPKTACVMGAAVWLFSECLKNLDGLALQTESGMIQQRECFIGTFSPQIMNLETTLFPSPAAAPAVLQTSGSTMLGVRRIDSKISPVNPLWQLTLDLQNIKGQAPFSVTLAQDPEHRECLTVTKLEDTNGTKCDVRCAKLRLRTMVDDQYWLDTGSFDV